MTYNAPDLSGILVNEQTLSTRLTNLQTLLRDILDDVGVEYSSSNSIIELIDLFVYIKQYYWQNTTITKAEDESDYDDDYYIEVVLTKLSDIIQMNNISYAGWNNAGDDTLRGKFNLTSDIRAIETNSAAFGCFADNGKVTLLKDWSMKIGFIPRTSSNYPITNLVGIGILISGSGDNISSSSNYHSAFAGFSRDDQGIHPAWGSMANRSVPNSTVFEDSVNLVSGSKYYLEFLNNVIEGKISVNFYDVNDDIVYTTEIEHSDIYDSTPLVQTYKIYFGAFNYSWALSRDDELPDFVICDGYIDAEIGGT